MVDQRRRSPLWSRRGWGTLGEGRRIEKETGDGGGVSGSRVVEGTDGGRPTIVTVVV